MYKETLIPIIIRIIIIYLFYISITRKKNLLLEKIIFISFTTLSVALFNGVAENRLLLLSLVIYTFIMEKYIKKESTKISLLNIVTLVLCLFVVGTFMNYIRGLLIMMFSHSNLFVNLIINMALCREKGQEHEKETHF
jgi:hypothetical protein